MRLVILGKLCSMKNRKIQTKSGHVFKNPDVVAYERSFHAQVPASARKRLDGPVAVTVEAFYPSRRADLDVALVYDCLQSAEVIVNDRQIIEQHSFRHVDKDNPRVEIHIRELDNG